MRIGVVSDVHANIFGLEAVAGALAEARAKRLVFLGDALGMGPKPLEVLDRLRELCDTFVLGNADAEVLDPEGPQEADQVRRHGLEIARWTGEQLRAEDKDFLASLEPRMEMREEEVELLAYHGTPRSLDDGIDPWISPQQLDEFLGGFGADVNAGGHTHLQFARRHRTAWILNPGSAGYAYDRTHPTDAVRLAGFAEFALLETGRDGCNVFLCRVPFDVDAQLAALRASDMPHAEWLANGYAWGAA